MKWTSSRGVFDERFLGRYDASGTVLEEVPIGLSVPSHDPLANRDKITVRELNGRTVLIPQTGMLEDFDESAEALLRLAPGAKTVEFELLDVETFNRAAATGAVILNIGCWTEAHPLFRHVPLDWEQKARFGFIFAKNACEAVCRFVETVRENDSRPAVSGGAKTSAVL